MQRRKYFSWFIILVAFLLLNGIVYLSVNYFDDEEDSSDLYDLTGKKARADSTAILVHAVDSFLRCKRINSAGLKVSLYQVWWERPVYWINISIKEPIGKRRMKKFRHDLLAALRPYLRGAEYRGNIKTSGWKGVAYEYHSFGFDSNELHKPDY